MPILRLPTTIAGLKANRATVLRWLKQPGQAVSKGEPVVELDVEDALIHIEATESGALGRIIAASGKTIPLGAELAEFNAGASATPPVQPVQPNKGMTPMPSPVSSGKVTPILMPQAGNTMEEGRIIKWLVKPGDRIAVGQVICEIETDKATIEFESTDAGRVSKLVAAEGDVILVKQPILILAENDADGANTSPAPSAPVPTSAPSAKPAPGGKVVPLLMPQAGNSMEEGTIIKWNVKPGDTITLGQIIYEIDTDKASVEVEATEAGRLARIIALPGTVVPVKQPVAFIADNDADIDTYLAGASPSPGTPGEGRDEGSSSHFENATPSRQNPHPDSRQVGISLRSTSNLPEYRERGQNGGRQRVSPAARRIAAARGLDLSTISSGSGPGGRILSTDLDRARTVTASVAAKLASGGMVRKPLSKMRKAIATNLQVSKQTVPHFYVTLTINADPLFAFYKAQKPSTGCTLNDVVLLAVGKTVGEFPAFRSRIEGNEIVEFPNANIGLAVSVDDGLVVPVVLAVENHSLSTLPAESKRIVEASRKGKLENIGKGVFTISNMGMLGVENFSAIINPPESGILAVAAVREAVIVKDGAMRAGRVMSMTLSVDHRVVDGAMAALFMNKLKEQLENPETLLK